MRKPFAIFKKGTNIAIDSNYAEYIIKGLSYVAENSFYQGKIKEAKDQLVKALYLATTMNANNAIIQIKVLLRSLGLSEDDIQKNLEEYRKSRN